MSTSQPKASRAKVHLAAPDRVIWIVVAAIVVWGVWAFGSELMLNLRLNAQVQSLRQQNAQLAAANDLSQRQLAVGSSPAAMEEAARKAGFSRPGEQVYVIVKPSDAASAAAIGESLSPNPVVHAGRQTAHTAPMATRNGGGVIGTIEQWWRNLWH